ncbi:hypothetical protein [Saccharothrix xinjiangensis]|uniref:Secreted protein n=1 Tax=Saccharothrix xinjiangensis TaxID=204798 RepID=A0ABV9XX65_9PSEU
MPLEQTTALVSARQPSTEKDPGGQQEDFGKSSPLGLLLLVLFLIAVFFLVKSMNKHLKRVPASFDDPEPAEDAAEYGAEGEVKNGAGGGKAAGGAGE